MKRLDQEVFVCLDCETTGLDSEADQIIEIAVTKFSFEGVIEEFETLVNPQREISPESIAIHHITQEMVQHKPTIAEVLPRVLEIIQHYIIVGHGIKFDIEMVAKAAERSQQPTRIRQNRYMDTLRMARLYGESPIKFARAIKKTFQY